MNKEILVKRILPVIAGAGLGYAYYYFIGCNNGCVIQSSPFLSTLYGALMGFLISFPSKKKKKSIENESANN